MPQIPVTSPLGYVGIFLLLFGFFLILAGSGIIKIEKVVVTPGPRTWRFGILLAVLGMGFLLPDILGSLSLPRTPTTTVAVDDFEAFDLLWHRREGYPSVSPGKISLVGPVDIQTHDEYKSGNLTVTAEASVWAPDTSIGFEIWVGSDRYSIRVSRGRLILETPEESHEEAIPDWSGLWAGPITFKISWSGSQVKLHIDGQPILGHMGPEVPTRSLRVRLRAAEGDVLTVTQIEVTEEPISSRGSNEIIVDSFEYANDAEFEAAWETDITSPSGRTEVEIDTEIFAPNVAGRKSLKIETYIPCLQEGDRRQQIQQYWAGGPQDWSDSNVLAIWVRGDGVKEKPRGGELSIVLIDGDGEVWQSTRWFDRTSDWTEITIPLVGRGVGNPWDYRKAFVIPEWESDKAVNMELDTEEILAIWIKSLTTDGWACGTEKEADGAKYPLLTIWVDHIVRY